MKRITTVTLALLGVFLFGFWAGRSPLLMTMKTPSRPNEIRATNEIQRFTATEFLWQELERARATADRERTPESKRLVEELENRFTKALIIEKSNRAQ